MRRGLCGAFRAKRRRTPQRVLTPAIDSRAATSFFAHSLAARDVPAQVYSLRAWPARAARPAPLGVARPDLRIPCVPRDSALLLLHLPPHTPEPWLVSAHNAYSAASVAENAPGTALPNRC